MTKGIELTEGDSRKHVSTEVLPHLTRKEVSVIRDTGAGSRPIEYPGEYNGFLGISLGSRISNEDLRIYISWALKYFKNVLVLIDDWEHRINYRVLDGLSEEEATAKALRQGQEWVRRFEKIRNGIHNPSDREKISVKCSSEYFQSGACEEILKQLTQAFEGEEGPKFRQDIMDQVWASIGDRIHTWKQRASPREYQDGLRILPTYLLKETAITIWLVEHGYPIEMYQGDYIRAVAELYEDKDDFDKGGHLFPRYHWLKENLNLRADYGHINFMVKEIPAESMQHIRRKSIRLPTLQNIFKFTNQMKIGYTTVTTSAGIA